MFINEHLYSIVHTKKRTTTLLFKLLVSGFLFLFFCVIKLDGNSGDGTPYLTNIKYVDNQQNYVWSVEQSFQGTMLIAGKSGLLEFDAANWSLIEVPDIALALKTSKFNFKIYVSGRNFIGYLSTNKLGRLSYNSILSDSLPQGNYKEIIESKSCIYFYSAHAIICIDKNTNYLIKSWIAADNPYLGLFTTGTSVYLNIANDGLHEIKNNELVKVNSNLILNKSILFSTKYTENKTLIGTDNGDLFLFDRINLTPYTIDNQEFIKTGILSDGVSVDVNTLALSTMNYGVLLIEKKTGKTLDIINYDCGLPNDFIMDLFLDNQDGLWMAHSHGLSRIDTRLPMANFSSYSGLTSSIISVNFWNDKLYAATSTGVYSLETINQYSTKEIIIRRPVKSIPVKRTSSINRKEDEISKNEISSIEIKDIPKSEAVQPESKQKKRTGFIKKLFSKDENEVTKKDVKTDERNEKSIESEETIKVEEPDLKYNYQKYNKSFLKSKDFGFVQLPVIDTRCKLLIPFDEELLAVTDAKLYSVNKKNNVNEIFNSTQIYTVLKSKFHGNSVFVVTNNGIYQGVFNKSKWDFKLSVESTEHFKITDFVELDEDNLLVAKSSEIFLYSMENESVTQLTVYNPYSERAAFKAVNNTNYLLIGNALYAVHFKNKKEIVFEKIHNASIVNSFLSQEDNLWIRTENNNFKYYGNAKIPGKIFSFLRVFENIVDIQIDNNGNLWVVDDFENIYQLKTADFENYKIDVSVIIKEIKTLSGNYLIKQNTKVSYSENALTFTLASPSYLKFNLNEYQYIIEGLMNDWSEWNSENVISVPFLPPGNYVFKVRTRNLFGEISEIESFGFKIVPPFWRTPYFYIICVILLVVGLIIRQRIKILKHIHANKILQQKVKERTIELELKNKSITDSIVYAERIQKGILPIDELIGTSLTEYFILYKPRNIVSGDFYWLSQKENITYIVAADCTGHGVPGAFMSMLGVAYLNEIVRISNTDITAAEILEELRERITRLFSQESFTTNDGIDIALLIIDSSGKKIQFCGAYNPLYQVTSDKNNQIDKGKIEEVNNGKILLVHKADRFHVGKSTRNLKKFTNHIIPYCKDDTFYIFSDGFVDQFGGDEESKFKYGPFKNLILEISEKPMEIQKETLLTSFMKWKGNSEQTDDILIWGLKLPFDK